MNYLSHFYIDHKKGRHYFNTGLILPDLSKVHVKHFRSPVILEHQFEFYELQNGCLRHYERDKQFHSSLWFNELNKNISAMVNEAGFSTALNRKWFLSHVLTELMIDRILVKEYPEVNESFYHSLRETDVQILTNYLQLFNAMNISQFLSHFEHFRKVAFVGYYPDTNKFVYSLTRILMRVGLPEMSSADQLILAGLCEDVESRFFSNRREKIQQLKQLFHA